jgi:pilus assembly protein CpaB
MKPKTVILLVVAVGCGLVASVMTSRLIAERGDGPQEKMVKVLVTKAKIRQFDLLKEPQKVFEEKDVPESSAHKKAIHSFDELKDKRVTRPLSEETTITSEDLVTKDLNLLANDLVPGSRAVAFRVSPECLAGGFVLPGSRVDILHTMRQGDKQGTRTIMQHMLVLAVDQQNSRGDDAKQTMVGNTVTMAVRPREAELLTLASQTGELRLVLRPLGEDKPVSVRGATIEDLLKPGSTDTEATDPEGKEPPGGLGSQVPPIPTLPRTEKQPEKPPETTPPVAEPVVKKHTLTLIQGDQIQKVTFSKGVEGEEIPKPAPAPKKETPSKSEPATPEKSADATAPTREAVAVGSSK